MARELTDEGFARLLASLDPDPSLAGERYEDLRRMLVRFFEWRGVPFPDEHADETLDRVVRKLDEGEAIRNIGGYCYTVARLIVLEALKDRRSHAAPLGAIDVAAPADRSAETSDAEAHLACLDACLNGLTEESRSLILEYYRDDGRRRIAGRRELAGRLGLSAEALANRAQRLRDKLDRCVTGCVGDMNTARRH